MIALLTEALANVWLRAFLYSAVLITVLMSTAAWVTWFERKFAGRLQSRLGPTMVGPKGLLQPIADGLKMLQKEQITPDDADKVLFELAPPLTVFFALATAAVIPFTPGMLASDLDIGVLYILALSGLMAFPIWVGAWASNNKYALLGGMRAVAQGISYEIPMVLSALVPVVLAGSLSLGKIVEYQAEHGWLILWPPGLGLIAFVVFTMTALAEGNRIPFDIPEAESELVAGATTEYTGIKFGLFATAEYLHSMITCAVAAALFFGGWDGPWAPGLGWMVLKTIVLFVLLTWVRWSLLRLRSDQLMQLCWKYLVPGTLGLLMVSGLWVYFAG